MYRQRNIVFVGFKGSGKTEAARFLAAEFGFRVAELDGMIERLYFSATGARLKYREIIPRHGVDYFNQLERKALRSAAGMSGIVIATAGNTPIKKDNRDILRRLGIIILLELPKELVFRSITENGAPYYLDMKRVSESFGSYFSVYSEAYREIADYIVKAGGKEGWKALKGLLPELRELVTFS